MLFPRLLYISNCFYILIEKKINKKMLHFLSNETLFKQETRFYWQEKETKITRR